MKICNKRGSIFIGALICILALSPLTLKGQQVMEVLKENSDISLFVDAIQKAELNSKLDSGGPYTIFAPNNEALQRTGNRLNRSSRVLREFVLNHILTGRATKRHIKAMSKAPTLGGLVLRMEVDDGNVKINEVEVVRYNIRAQNGVVHIIDGVLE